MKHSREFDNRLPDSYPVFEEAEYSDRNLIVEIGDCVIDRDGHLMIVTTSNKEEYPNEYLRSINEPFFRAKFMGNHDDLMAFANQVRFATIDEVELVCKFVSNGGFHKDSNGQLRLV